MNIPAPFAIPAVLVFSFLFVVSGSVLAQTSLEVSGIVSGRDPVAIVNGETVKQGGRVQEFTVEEIGRDFVRFTSASGESVTKRLGEKAVDAHQTPVENIPSPVRDPISDSDRDATVKQYAAQAAQDIDAADHFLRSQGVANPAAQKQAIALYGKAERGLQLALEKTAVETEARNTIKTAIAGVRDISRKLSKEKRDLEEKIRTAVESHKVVMGMTKEEVIKSVGRPGSVNTANDRGDVKEQWIYGDPSRKATYLYFNNGILSSFQY